ncbi:phosphotransferase family enzyme [Nonomuraea polychroma]|uniref:Phosphotransferase family enzyme n=1 Tax=Nonomuraea polychroma TaxID=46176 RepID=A0A438LZ71_9ACTN|nr:class V lanthionine synthetase subunit LxmK [Nonomuraea polychroma]RVX38845.1 phosphotransferase family enzyme [Nonomuraea polychroma]
MTALTNGEKDTAKGWMAPIDLDRVPDVEAFLDRLGYGRFDRETLVAPIGRNEVWAGRTDSGRKVFVKRLIGGDDAKPRLRRMLAFERFKAARPVLADQVRTPAFLGADEDAGLVAFDFMHEARNGAEAMIEESFGDELARQVGEAIGHLHNAGTQAGEGLDDGPFPLPDLRLLRGLPLEMWHNLSYGEMESWSILHGDPELMRGILALCEWESRSAKVPVHGDFRVDQLLLPEDGGFQITDWEDFRLGDPARDVGAFAGEWLFRSILDIVSARGDEVVFEAAEFTHEMVLQRGAEKIERLRPRIHGFWQGYRAVRPGLDDEFAARATAFAGWHMMDRLLASGARSAKLSGIQRAAAGIGRTALLAPARFTIALGLEDE